MGVVIEICAKYPGGRTRITVTDIPLAYLRQDIFDGYPSSALPNLPSNHMYDSIYLYSEHGGYGT